MEAGPNIFLIASDADHGAELRVITLPEPSLAQGLFAGAILCHRLRRRRDRRAR